MENYSIIIGLLHVTAWVCAFFFDLDLGYKMMNEDKDPAASYRYWLGGFVLLCSAIGALVISICVNWFNQIRCNCKLRVDWDLFLIFVLGSAKASLVLTGAQIVSSIAKPGDFIFVNLSATDAEQLEAVQHARSIVVAVIIFKMYGITFLTNNINNKAMADISKDIIKA